MKIVVYVRFEMKLVQDDTTPTNKNPRNISTVSRINYLNNNWQKSFFLSRAKVIFQITYIYSA